MSGDAPVELPEAVWNEVFAHARECFPNECCGWLEGPAGGPAVTLVRRCENAQGADENASVDGRAADTAYVIAGADLLALGKAIDDKEQPAKVIYHSHPNGRAYFSDTDKAVATSPWGDGPTYPVQQLVVGIDGDRVVESALFAWSDSEGGFVEIARFPGPTG